MEKESIRKKREGKRTDKRGGKEGREPESGVGDSRFGGIEATDSLCM